MNLDTRSGDQTYLQSLNERIPAGRWGTPDDMKGSAIFLASEASNYIHGHIMLVRKPTPTSPTSDGNNCLAAFDR